MPDSLYSNLSEFIAILELSDFLQITIIHQDRLIDRHVPPFPADIPTLVVGSGSDFSLASEILRTIYPSTHPIKVVTGDDTVIEVALGDFDHPTIKAILIPPLDEYSSFESFHEIIAHLRAPDGCPWDREQTHLSLRKHLIEESYETLDAIDTEDPEKMREEFGDLLLQIVLHAQIASEERTFTVIDVLRSVSEKIVRRHPHVFGEVQVDGVDQVLQNWEALKSKERKANGMQDKGILDGLPAALPALNQAQEYQNRAARVGFDWPEIAGVLEKIREEIDEVRSANDHGELTAELGDLLFALVNLARWKKIDAESALREANKRFKRRFSYVENGARKKQTELREMSLDEMEALWQAAKRSGL